MISKVQKLKSHYYHWHRLKQAEICIECIAQPFYHHCLPHKFNQPKDLYNPFKKYPFRAPLKGVGSGSFLNCPRTECHKCLLVKISIHTRTFKSHIAPFLGSINQPENDLNNNASNP